MNMKHITTVQTPCIRAGKDSACGECQASCQSACKTSCTVANQSCQNKDQKVLAGRDGKTNHSFAK